jgi:hypothetical protein
MRRAFEVAGITMVFDDGGRATGIALRDPDLHTESSDR